MASTKTITVTNETVTIPAMTDRPDASQFSDGVSKLVDGINSNTQAIANTQGGLAYIVGNTNTTGSTLTVGQFVYVKGHSTIAEGLRVVTASISAGGNITTSNTSACSDGGLNALNSKIDTYVISSNTLSNVESALVSFGATLGEDEIHKIRFNISTATGVFSNQGYMGTIKKYGTASRYTVEVQNCAYNAKGVIITGNYYEGSWNWDSLSSNLLMRTYTASASGTSLKDFAKALMDDVCNDSSFPVDMAVTVKKQLAGIDDFFGYAIKTSSTKCRIFIQDSDVRMLNGNKNGSSYAVARYTGETL